MSIGIIVVLETNTVIDNPDCKLWMLQNHQMSIATLVSMYNTTVEA